MENTKKDIKKDKKTSGEILKQKRLEKGLSLRTIHDATKIPMDALRGIEEGYNAKILSPFYLKGFIKMYAKYLGVDVAEVLNNDKKEELPRNIEKKIDNDFDIKLSMPQIFTRKRKKKLIYFVSVLFLFFILFKIITAFTHRGKYNNVTVPIVNKSDLNVTKKDKKAEIISKTSHTTKKLASANDNIIKLKKTRTENKKSYSNSTNTSKSVMNNNTMPNPIARKQEKAITLTIRAKKKGWLTVKVDDVIVFQSSIGLGVTETWFADKKIEISGNIINQIEFDLNHKLIGPLGRKDRRAKRVIITRNGLKVSK